MADGSTFHMEGGGSSAPETSRPVHWQFSPTSESARRALNGTMARVRAQLLPAGTATDEVSVATTCRHTPCATCTSVGPECTVGWPLYHACTVRSSCMVHL